MKPLVHGTKLTSRQEEVLNMVVNGATYQEIARVQGCSRSNVSQMMIRARKRYNAASTPQLVAILLKEIYCEM